MFSRFLKLFSPTPRQVAVAELFELKRRLVSHTLQAGHHEAMALVCKSSIAELESMLDTGDLDDPFTNETWLAAKALES